ncbi:hypothetical protein [Peribacillus sp. NPDC060253]|uniref:hypothetical protein n=1 Tax=Peribacillus sp. NPDC060253 TaxID=3347084 RepID=UPI00365CCC24
MFNKYDNNRKVNISKRKPNLVNFTDDVKRKISESNKNRFKENPEMLIYLSEAKSTIAVDVVKDIKTMLYNDVNIKEIAELTNVGIDKINHISNINSFSHILPQYNYYIKNRHTIHQFRNAKKVMSMYRNGCTYREIGEALELHQRNAIRIVNKNKTIHDDRCRLNCINRSLRKQYSIIKTLQTMGKNSVQISKLLRFSRPQVCKILNRNEPNIVTSLEGNRGKIKPFKVLSYII